MLEAKMKMDQVLKGFMIDLHVEIYTKNSSLAGQALDMCLKLVVPEYSHKPPWNRHKDFIHFLEQRNVSSVLFAYRFGCLSRAVAVLVYNFDHLVEFLYQNPHIKNRLACLV